MQSFCLHNADMEKHERLKLARETKFSTLAAAVRYLGMKYSTVAHHEAGTRGIKENELRLYARVYRVNLAWLAHEQGPQHGSDDPVLTAEEDEMLDGFKSLPPEARQTILRVVRGFTRT